MSARPKRCVTLKPRACRTARSASWPTTRTIGTLTRAARSIGTATARTTAPKALAQVQVSVQVLGAAGLMAGLGLLAIPGVGPVVAAGWLAATAAGAAAGGLTGGIVGALTQAGVSDDEAHVYAEGVRRGGTLVTARVSDADASRLEGILDRSSLKTADLRTGYQKSGWKTFDENGKAYSADEVRQYRSSWE